MPRQRHKSVQSVIFYDCQCDGCGQEPIREECWECSVCCNVIFCAQCKKRSIASHSRNDTHKPKHPLQTMKPPTQGHNMRMQLGRYPNSLITDWSGQYLDPRIRDHLQVGNIVRIPIEKFHSDTGSACTAYYRIVAKNRRPGWFRAVCEDPYYGSSEWFPVHNGDMLCFSKHHVMEIPLDWRGNESLVRYSRPYRFARMVTGSW